MVLVGLTVGMQSYQHSLYLLRCLLSTDDTPHDMDMIAQKVYGPNYPLKIKEPNVYSRLNIKAFPDATSNGQWKSSVTDRGGEVLCVSQFTLYAKLNKNKPDFHKSMVFHILNSLTRRLTEP